MKFENNHTKKTVFICVLCVVIGLISLFKGAPYFTDVNTYEKTIISLDEKKTTVLELTAAAAATSTAITLLPGDAATPIADKLAQLSSYFLIVLCALYLEKYLLTVMGAAAFALIIPIACVVGMIAAVSQKAQLLVITIKLAIFAVVAAAIIPLSVQVSDMIEDTYQTSMQDTIESANKTAEDIQGSADDGEISLKRLLNKFKDGVTGAVKKVENVLNQFIESVAVMIVTSCLIPIAVILIFVWLTKILLGINIDVSKKIKG